jgi:hypothetical protein
MRIVSQEGAEDAEIKQEKFCPRNTLGKRMEAETSASAFLRIELCVLSALLCDCSIGFFHL